ncbi:MAG: hypothetical protein HY817_05915 [Candidatus Abawacabacteria bacterium]|nr:hypothetical protein [Candidatus Abawacabacteria bacterium]
MSQKSKLVSAYEMLRSAENAIVAAKEILASLEDIGTGGSGTSLAPGDLAEPRMEGNVKIVEGVFDGQNMLGQDQRIYPVPANYASKSKLIPGDHLKLTIAENGAFKYKQIGPIPRREVVGIVTYNDGQYQIMAENKLYKVLLASITYYKAEVGSSVTIIIPQEGDSEWCAIEHLLPS